MNGVYDKGFIWNPSNCDCDKACNVGEYLDYGNCKCRQKLVDKLVDECTETVEEVKLAKITLAKNENSYKCTFCTVYTVLFWIFFTINVGGIGAYFVYYHRYLKKMFTRETTIYQTYKLGEVKQINIKNRTYYFYNNIIDLKGFEPNLLKIDKKAYKNIDIYYIEYITIKKIDDYESIYGVNPLYLRINHTSGFIEEKN